jgi:hypothetical protein
MDLAKVLQQLRQDLANLDTAIASLERLEQTGRGRGRPAEIGESAPQEPPRRRGRKPKAVQPPGEAG